MTDDIFDFGFTAVTEEELEVVTNLKEKADSALTYYERLNELFNAIQPLLTNLKANPEKDYIMDYIRHKLRIYQASSQKIDAFIFGHRHCLIDYDCGDGTRYINLGDWIMQDYANAGFVKINEEGILFDKIKPYLT